MPKPEFAFFLHKDPSKGGAVIWGGGAERLGSRAVQCCNIGAGTKDQYCFEGGSSL